MCVYLLFFIKSGDIYYSNLFSFGIYFLCSVAYFIEFFIFNLNYSDQMSPIQGDSPRFWWSVPDKKKNNKKKQTRKPTLSPICRAKTLHILMTLAVETGMSPVPKENTGKRPRFSSMRSGHLNLLLLTLSVSSIHLTSWMSTKLPNNMGASEKPHQYQTITPNPTQSDPRSTSVSKVKPQKKNLYTVHSSLYSSTLMSCHRLTIARGI